MDISRIHFQAGYAAPDSWAQYQKQFAGNESEAAEAFAKRLRQGVNDAVRHHVELQAWASVMFPRRAPSQPISNDNEIDRRIA